MGAHDNVDIKNTLQIVKGEVSHKKLTLYAVMKEEIFLLRPFFEHYRRIGIEQFLILDDFSKDGTREFLLEQPDCVVLTSCYSFGQRIKVKDRSGKKIKSFRAGVQYQQSIPGLIFGDEYSEYVLQVDADEFLLLPPGVNSISEIIDELRERDIDCIVASLVEFYPEKIADIETTQVPQSFDDLIKLYSYFDAAPLLELCEGERPKMIGKTNSAHHFERNKINDSPPFLSWLPRWFRWHMPFKRANSSWCKIPIVRWNSNTRMVGYRYVNEQSTHEALLTMAHFVFNAKFSDKVENAKQWRGHHRRGRKYYQYQELLRLMKHENQSFLSPNSEKFENEEQLVRAGLMRWDW